MLRFPNFARLERERQRYAIARHGEYFRALVFSTATLLSLQRTIAFYSQISTGCEDEENPKCFVVACKWDPLEPALENLNIETSRLRLTLAVDLVIKQIKESVRLPLKIQCKIFPQNERFWSFSKGQLFYHFNMYLKEVSVWAN